MSNTLAHLVRALVFACFFPLSAVAIAGTKMSSGCVVGSAPSLNFDAQFALVANVERSATVQVQCARATPYRIDVEAGATAYGHIPSQSAPEFGNHADTITVTVMY